MDGMVTKELKGWRNSNDTFNIYHVSKNLL